jgi:hypothetical protein
MRVYFKYLILGIFQGSVEVGFASFDARFRLPTGKPQPRKDEKSSAPRNAHFEHRLRAVPSLDLRRILLLAHKR